MPNASMIKPSLSLAPRAARRTFLLAGTAFAALSLAGSALAAEIEAKSRIEAVTVYPDGAIVTRGVEIDLPQGATLLVFKGMPASIDPASLRVEGQAAGALSLGSIETRLTPADPGRPTGANDEQLRALRLDREKLAVDLESIEGRKVMIQRYAQSSPERQGEQGKGLDVEKWASAWEAVGSALAKANEEQRKAKLALREVEEKIRAIEAADAARRLPRTTPEREFTLALEAGQALKGKLVLSYRVSGAAWRPAYDAHLETGEAGKAAVLKLTRRALVTQRSGEDWSDVAMTLSTVRAARGTAAPDLAPERVAFYEIAAPVAMGRARSMATESAADLATRKEAPAPAAPAAGGLARQQALIVAEATLDTNGFEASYRIPGSIFVPKDGAQKSFAIQTRSLVPELLVRAAPSLDPTAYLEAAFVNSEEAPLLAGEVTLIRDNAFIGKGRVAFTAPGDRAQLGFGADDRVKVSRVPLRRRESEPSILGSTKSDTREFKILVKNLHSFPMKTVITDQMPFSEAANITVELLPATTPPTDKSVQDRRGVMAWSHDLKPNEEKDIRLAYRIRWPSDRELVFERQPQTR